MLEREGHPRQAGISALGSHALERVTASGFAPVTGRGTDAAVLVHLGVAGTLLTAQAAGQGAGFQHGAD